MKVLLYWSFDDFRVSLVSFIVSYNIGCVFFWLVLVRLWRNESMFEFVNVGFKRFLNVREVYGDFYFK